MQDIGTGPDSRHTQNVALHLPTPHHAARWLAKPPWRTKSERQRAPTRSCPPQRHAARFALNTKPTAATSADFQSPCDPARHRPGVMSVVSRRFRLGLSHEPAHFLREAGSPPVARQIPRWFTGQAKCESSHGAGSGGGSIPANGANLSIATLVVVNARRTLPRYRSRVIAIL